jgi:bidirectional [NiFe] hydrogenase diaphorase subunit
MDLAELLTIAEKKRATRKAICIRCCTATGCQSANSLAVKQRLEEAITEAGLDERVCVKSVGCLSLCGNGPLVAVEHQDTFYEFVTPEQAPSIIAAINGGESTAQRGDFQHPFFTQQLRIVCEHDGQIDPEEIDDYIAVGGYQTLYHVLHELTPAQVIDIVIGSGLRGRGGAGYPTGLKWSTVAKAAGQGGRDVSGASSTPSPQKYVICNGDEGDPGAFMDRSVLESDPHRVLEGMAIAAYAVGANQGYLYVRGEYPLAIRRLQIAIQQAKKHGLLGSQIFETPFDFRVDIRIGAGAFVCGEETALMASIAGRRGQPRPRPPYPAEHGLWGCPTLINNVETFANIVPIIRDGPEWFASIGTETSKGTKVFALAGKVRNTGLVEAPMGTTLHQIVEEMGGGAPDGRVKAVQTGGPSGGCIPAELFDTPIDYESLARIGSIMGSGGMVVMDEHTSMVDVARFYVEFCMDESCGKCIPCRVGTVQLYRLLTKIRQGEATRADLEALRTLCDLVRNTSLCGLGQSAPNPILSTLRYFLQEYEELIKVEK